MALFASEKSAARALSGSACLEKPISTFDSTRLGTVALAAALALVVFEIVGEAVAGENAGDEVEIEFAVLGGDGVLGQGRGDLAGDADIEAGARVLREHGFDEFDGVLVLVDAAVAPAVGFHQPGLDGETVAGEAAHLPPGPLAAMAASRRTRALDARWGRFGANKTSSRTYDAPKYVALRHRLMEQVWPGLRA
jgi:hypothetical protein